MRSTTPERLAACHRARLGLGRYRRPTLLDVEWFDSRECAADAGPKTPPGMQAVACGFDSETPELSQVMAELKQMRELLETGSTEGRPVRVALVCEAEGLIPLSWASCSEPSEKSPLSGPARDPSGSGEA